MAQRLPAGYPCREALSVKKILKIQKNRIMREKWDEET